VRQFLRADLIDFLHLVIVPVTLGRGGYLVLLQRSLVTAGICPRCGR
jgi:riboflavin biosynthesis pyrimidine reductase